MLLPDSMEVRICVPFNSRSTAWASFDGRGRVELKRACVMPMQASIADQALVSEGDHIKVTASKFPFPTVCADKQSTDWFHAISRTLKWNERERQKSFVVVEEGPAREKHKHHQRNSHLEATASAKGVEEGGGNEDEDNSDEEEEKFDIDDLSSENSDATPAAGSGTDSGIGSSTKTSPSSAAASRAAEAIMGVSPSAHAKARTSSHSRSGVRSGVDSPNRFAPPRQSQHVQWAASVPGGANDKASQGDSDICTPTAAVHARRTRSRSPAAPSFHSHPHPRAFAVWGQDESDSNSSDNDP
jgi:NAD+ kinase